MSSLICFIAVCSSAELQHHSGVSYSGKRLWCSGVLWCFSVAVSCCLTRSVTDILMCLFLGLVRSPSTSSSDLGPSGADLATMLTQIITARNALELGGGNCKARTAQSSPAKQLPPRAATPGSTHGMPAQSAQASQMLAQGSTDLLQRLSRGQSGSGPLAEQSQRGWRQRRGSKLTGRRAAQMLHSAAGGGGNSLDGASANSSASTDDNMEDELSSDEAEAGLEAAAASSSSQQKLPSPQMPPIEQVEQVLQSANEWQWDAFALAEATNGHPLSTLAYFLFSKQGLIEHYQLRPTALARFLRRIESGYRTNPYHNATHASDVLQTMHCIITRGGLMPGYVDPMHLMACYTAAVISLFPACTFCASHSLLQYTFVSVLGCIACLPPACLASFAQWPPTLEQVDCC